MPINRQYRGSVYAVQESIVHTFIIRREQSDTRLKTDVTKASHYSSLRQLTVRTHAVFHFFCSLCYILKPCCSRACNLLSLRICMSIKTKNPNRDIRTRGRISPVSRGYYRIIYMSFLHLLSGLVKELDTHKFDYATKHLVSHGTYILVMKEPVAVDSTDARAPSPPEQRYTYTPLLEKFAELFPHYTVHVQEVDKKKTRKSANKSPSPAGRMGLKSRKGVVKTSTTARRR